ncbi:unnamed protein product [Adineta steineri]|uniref:Uncharacterized protein n=1 Tax=Adineta steineri TaxID=433720 RepID=A0A814PP65_9BILA|nr:unnamed protein product [Adineta steineri]
MAQSNKRIRISILIIIIYILSSYYFFVHFYKNYIVWIPFLSSNLTQHRQNNRIHTVSSSSVTYSLDSECKFDPNDALSQNRSREFDIIFETGRWAGGYSRSGLGSTVEGAYGWINELRTFFKHYSIQSIADIPCGDTTWQFSLQHINTIEQLYFGGDISTKLIEYNQKLYASKHSNKLFQYWDLVNCPISTYTYESSICATKGNRFDLIIVRDALQHMNIRNGLKAVRNVIMSGAKYFAVSTYPANGKSSAANTRSIAKNEPLPSMPVECQFMKYCTLGNIPDGDFYRNNINCDPFNFPLNKAILVQPSHQIFYTEMERDEIHIYKIDDELKQIVKQYDEACIEGDQQT